MKKLGVVFLIIFGIVLSACKWTDVERVDQVTWSDDDGRQAFVLLRYQKRNNETRNHSWQLYLQNADGSGRQALTSTQPHPNGPRLYYMKGASYLLAEVIEAGNQFRYDVIRLDGSTTTFRRWTTPASPCAGLEIVPSPDGTNIGLMEQLPSTDCASGMVKGALYDAATLAADASYSWAVTGTAEATWTPSGDFVIRDNTSAWRLDRYNGPMPQELPGCVYPKTTSSAISAAGVKIKPGPNLGNPVVVAATGVTPFGCQ